MSLLEQLNKLADAEYKAFNKKIIPTKQVVLGVRLPALRKIAKNISRENSKAFLAANKNNIFEMVFLEGLVISLLDVRFQELLPLLDSFFAKVDNWAQIDTTVCGCKNISKEKEAIVPIISTWLTSEEEFVVRAGLVMLLAHYVEREYLDQIFTLSQSVTHAGYYVMMANAWLISVCMAKFPNETILFLKNNSLNAITHNKAIQKSKESRRISQEHKDLLAQLKKSEK